MNAAATTIGFIGLGAMGLPMAINLLGAGYPVRGFDLNPAALDAFAAAGGTIAASVADAADGAGLLVLMVVNAAQVRSVLFDGAALAALPKDAIVVVTATCPPSAMQPIADRIAAAGCRLLDAPVSGGVVGARAATLTIMAAGSDDVFADARPVLAAMGGKVVQVGREPGQGALVKTLNQLLCGVHLAAAAEAFALAAKVGLDAPALFDIVGTSAASSWMLRDRGPRMMEPDPDVTSAVDIFVKDLGIVMEAGREMKAALPLAAIAHQMFLAASGAGHGAEDDSQVIKAYNRLNGR